MTTKRPLQAQTDINQAIALHQQGDLENAQACYEAILNQQPEHADALHLLGVVEQQKGHPDKAIQLIQKALTVTPNNAVYLNNLGSVYLHSNADKADSFTRTHALLHY